MEKVDYQTSTLGFKGQGSRVDKAIAQEFGWGKHTFESCYINFDGKTINNCNQNTNNYTIIRSNGCIYSSDVGILLILTSDPDDLISHTMKSFKKEEKYLIRYENIADIIIERGLQYDDSIKPFSNQHKEKGRQRSILHFKDNGCCFIDTFEGTLFSNHVLYVWEGSIIRNTASLVGTKLIANSDHNLAKMYYDETIKSLNSSKNLEETIEILEEFSHEIQLDLELKEVAFQSRELYVKCFNLFEHLLNAPSGLVDDRKIKPKFNPATPRATPRNATATPRASLQNEEFVNRLTIIVLQRLKVMKAILHILVCSLFCSEFSTMRFGFIGGPTPLTVENWLELLVPDSYELLAESLGCPIDEKVDLKKELDKSFNVDEPMSRQSTRKDSIKRGYSIVEEIMTPVRRKLLQNYSGAQQSINNKFYEISEVNRGIHDMKYIVLLELSRICSIGIHHEKSKNFSRVCFGDIFSRTEAWRHALDKLIFRISSLLDDVLATHGLFSPRIGERLSLQEITLKSYNLSLNNSAATSVPPTPPKTIRKNASQNDHELNASPENKSRNNNLMKEKSHPISKFNYPAYSALETQEIILFYTTSLLKMMSMDSSRIRGEINEQAHTALSAIMNILNTICPRKEETFSNETFKQVPESIDNFGPKQNPGKCDSFFSRFIKKNEITENDVNEVRTVSVRNFLISDYGPCPINIAGDSWTLLVLSRRSIEQLLLTLNLNIPLKTTDKLLIDEINNPTSRGIRDKSLRNMADEEDITKNKVREIDIPMVDLSNTPVSTPPAKLEKPRRRQNSNLSLEIPASPTSPGPPSTNISDELSENSIAQPKRAYSPLTTFTKKNYGE